MDTSLIDRSVYIRIWDSFNQEAFVYMNVAEVFRLIRVKLPEAVQIEKKRNQYNEV